MLTAAPNVAFAPRTAFEKLIPVVPTSRRNFWKTDQVMSFLRLYQSGKTAAPVKVTLQVRDANGRAVFEDFELIEGAEFLFMQRRHADYQVQLPIAQLTPGRTS